MFLGLFSSGFLQFTLRMHDSSLVQAYSTIFASYLLCSGVRVFVGTSLNEALRFDSFITALRLMDGATLRIARWMDGCMFCDPAVEFFVTSYVGTLSILLHF